MNDTLTELSQRDSEWRKLAVHICGDPYLADDIVQEMYIKLSNKKNKINTSYVYLTMRSVYIDYLRKEKPQEELNGIPEFQEFCNISDEVLKIISKLPFVQRNILLLKQDKSFREIESEYNIKLSRVYTSYIKGVEKLKKNKKLKSLYEEITGKEAEKTT